MHARTFWLPVWLDQSGTTPPLFRYDATLNYRCLIFVRLSKVKQQAMKFDSLHENLGLIQDTFQTKIYRTRSKGQFYSYCMSDTKIT